MKSNMAGIEIFSGDSDFCLSCPRGKCATFFLNFFYIPFFCQDASSLRSAWNFRAGPIIAVFSLPISWWHHFTFSNDRTASSYASRDARYE